MNLTDFLLARIAEDEELLGLFYNLGGKAELLPERWKAECQAKRRIVQDLEGRLQDEASDPEDKRLVWAASVARETLWSMAFPYSDRPDFREEWRA